MSNIKQQKAHVSRVLEQILIDYKNARTERKALTETASEDDANFSLLEEIELLTVDIRGIGSQFTDSRVENYDEAVRTLECLRVFNFPSVTKFYFDPEVKAERLKSYISLLDYLCLLLIGYLQVENDVYAA